MEFEKKKIIQKERQDKVNKYNKLFVTRRKNGSQNDIGKNNNIKRK